MLLFCDVVIDTVAGGDGLRHLSHLSQLSHEIVKAVELS